MVGIARELISPKHRKLEFQIRVIEDLKGEKLSNTLPSSAQKVARKGSQE